MSSFKSCNFTPATETLDQMGTTNNINSTTILLVYLFYHLPLDWPSLPKITASQSVGDTSNLAARPFLNRALCTAVPIPINREEFHAGFMRSPAKYAHRVVISAIH